MNTSTVRLVYMVKNLSWIIIVSGIINMIVLYPTVFAKVDRSLMIPIVVIGFTTLLGIICGSGMSILISKSLRKRSQSTLFAISVFATYVIVLGLSLFVVNKANPAVYIFLGAGIYLLIICNRVRERIRENMETNTF